MLASASAAALATLAITVAVPALADDPGAANKGPDDLAACLRDHGLAGAPDGDDLKPWVGARLERRDAVTQNALEKCAPPKPVIVQRDGPDAKELRTCLTDHGVSLPAGDDRVLKRWVMEHGDDAANRAAMKACHMPPLPKPGDAGPCGVERHSVEVFRGSGGADKPASVKPSADGAN